MTCDPLSTLVLLVAALVCYLFLRMLTMASSFSYLNVKGLHCVVTGGSSGIGLEVAKLLAQQGADVTVIARDQRRLDAAVKEIKQVAVDNPRQLIESVSVDLAADYNVVRQAMEACSKKSGDIEVLINCAGYSQPQPFDVMDPSHYEQMLRINVVSCMYAARAVIGGMKTRKRGRIIFTSSMAGLCAVYGFTAYSASKFGIRGFAEALQMELHPFGIAIGVSYPPDTDTPGYAEENKVKDDICAEISRASGVVFSAKHVAKDLVEGMKAGRFTIATGFDGYLLSWGTAGFAPVFSCGEAMIQILSASVLRFVSICYNWYFYRIVAHGSKTKRTNASGRKYS